MASSGEHAAELARRAVESGVDVLAMLGGDGAAHAPIERRPGLVPFAAAEHENATDVPPARCLQLMTAAIAATTQEG